MGPDEGPRRQRCTEPLRRRTRSPERDLSTPTEALGVQADGWGWRHAGRRTPAVHDATFTIEPGERVLLLGASGAGKSTLMAALAGVLGGADEGDESGRLLVGGKHPTRRRGEIGLVLQDPQSQVVLARVGDDVAFGLENLGLPRAEIWPRVRWALDQVGLDLPLDRSTSALSSGQQQRLTLAGAVAMNTGLLLLDEPTANVDPDGVGEIVDAVGRVVADRTTTLVVVEHRVDRWLPLIDRVIVLSAGGGVLADGEPERIFAEHRDTLLDAGVWVPGVRPDLPDHLPLLAVGEPVLTADNLAIGHDGVPLRTFDRVALPTGSTALTGPNGSGKTTLAMTLAGLLPPVGGTIRARSDLRPPARRVGWRRRLLNPADPHQWASKELLTRIGTVFATPEHQLVAATVRDEIAVGLKALGRIGINDTVDELLTTLHLLHLANANPFTLSGGEKRRLSVGTVLATAPQIIVLDEPTFGQDRNTWHDLVRLVADLRAEGRTIVSVTHDRAYADAVADRRWQLTPAGRPSGESLC